MSDADLRAALSSGPLEVEGRLVDASNAVLVCRTESGRRCVYKPVRGERPLWDFPERTLGRREVAAYELAALAGWPVVPLTVWRDDGPFGPGMCQEWIDTDETQMVVDIVAADVVREGWLSVLEGEDAEGRRVQLIHAHHDEVQRVALLDAVANNADRKGGHLLVDADQRLWAIDHGVCFAATPKLRTVLWGWAGQPIPEPGLASVRDLLDRLNSASGEAVTRWLAPDETAALLERCQSLIDTGAFPMPTPDWPALPWPVI